MSCGTFLQEKERKRREAEEAARRAAEAERERKLAEAAEAEAAGNTEAAEAAFTEACIMDEARSYSIAPAEKPKAVGTTATKDWEIESIDQSQVPIDFCGMMLRPVDEAAVKRLIRASKGTVKIPGVKYKETMKMGFRR